MVVIIVLQQEVEDGAAVPVKRYAANRCLRYIALLAHKKSRTCGEVEMNG